MPSPLHEALVTLFRNCPTLAPGLMQARVEVPTFTEARIESADLTDVEPAEYRSDLVVVLRRGDPQLAIQLARIALDAVAYLDDGRAVLYGDWVVTSLPPATRKELFRVEPKLEYQSEWIRRAVGIGRVEGEAKGRAEGEAAALTKLLAVKFGPLDPPTLTRIQQGSLEELDTWLGRVLDATSLNDVFDP